MFALFSSQYRIFFLQSLSLQAGRSAPWPRRYPWADPVRAWRHRARRRRGWRGGAGVTRSMSSAMWKPCQWLQRSVRVSVGFRLRGFGISAVEPPRKGLNWEEKSGWLHFLSSVEIYSYWWGWFPMKNEPTIAMSCSLSSYLLHIHGLFSGIHGGHHGCSYNTGRRTEACSVFNDLIWQRGCSMHRLAKFHRLAF